MAKLNGRDIFFSPNINLVAQTDEHYDPTSDNAQSGKAVAEAVAPKADANNVYTKSETDTLLSAKANANTVYTKTETNNLLGDKQDEFATVTEIEGGGVELTPLDTDEVLLNGKFRFTPDPNAEENEYDIINREMLEAHHDATKQDNLTAGNGISIQNGVISSTSAGVGAKTEYGGEIFNLYPHGFFNPQITNSDLVKFKRVTDGYSRFDYTKGWSTIAAGNYRFEMDCIIYSGSPIIRVGSSQTGELMPQQSNYVYTYDANAGKVIITFTIAESFSENIGVRIGNYGTTSEFYCANPSLYLLDSGGNPTGNNLINTFASDYYYSSSTIQADKWNRRDATGYTCQTLSQALVNQVNNLNNHAIGSCSHAQGRGIIADADNSFAAGIYNDPKGNDLFEIGNGTDDSNRSNAFRVTDTGKVIGGTQTEKTDDSKTLATKGYIEKYYNYRTIADVTLSADGTGDYTITVDSNNQAFALAKVKVHLFVPADSADGNGYMIFNDATNTDAAFGAIGLQNNGTANYFVFEMEVDSTFPNYMKYVKGRPQLAAYNEQMYFERNGHSIGNVTKVQFHLNSGSWKAGTRFVVKGVDA